MGLVALGWHGDVQGQETWRRAYGSFGADEGMAVGLASDGNYVVAGHTGSFGAGVADIYMLKLDGAGNMLWSRTLGGPGIDRADDLLELQGGGWLLAGFTNGPGNGGYDGMLVKTDADGQEVWRKTYGGDDWDFLRKVIEVDDGFLAVGQTFSHGEGGDIWLVKTDPDGDMLWQMELGGSGLDDGIGLAATFDGGVVITGSTTKDNGDVDIYVGKLDGQYAVEWEITVGGDSVDVGRDILATNDGGYSIVGSTSSFSPHSEHYHVALDGAGNLLWQKNWGQIGDQAAYRHVQLADGTYATTGWTTTSGGGGRDMFLLLSDQQGDFIDQRTFGGLEDDEGYGLVAVSDGFVMCGMTKSYGAGNTDVFVVRTDGQGATMTEEVDAYFDPLKVSAIEQPMGMVRLYPNPSYGRVVLEHPERFDHIEVLNHLGQVVHTVVHPAKELELSGVATGALLIRLHTAEGRSVTVPIMLLSH